jgi:glutaredoxin 3
VSRTEHPPILRLGSPNSGRPWFALCGSWACRQAHILVDVPSRVILFSTDSCTLCISAKSLLAKRGVAFEEVNLAEDPELQAELAEVTGLTSFPQIIVDGETVGGLNELRAADKNGTLASWSSN